MGGLGVKVQHFPLTLLVVLTTLTLPCERVMFIDKVLSSAWHVLIFITFAQAQCRRSLQAGQR